MATHKGSEGVVKVGANAVAEVTGFSVDETADTIESTALSNSHAFLCFRPCWILWNH